MLDIYIPTMGRVHSQHTLDNLPKKMRSKAVLVCRSKDVEEIKEHKALGRNVLVCPKVGIAATRDWILNYADNYGQSKIVMFDDDIWIQRRRPSGKIDHATEDEKLEAFDWLDSTLKVVPHCGWSMRWLAFANKGPYLEPARMMKCLAYDVKSIKVARAGFCHGAADPSTFGIEDINMTIQLLLAGLPNRVSLEWRIKCSLSHAPGGAALWRTAAMQTTNAKELATAYPGVVKLREKKAWAGMEAQAMTDVTVYWQKALKIGRQNNV